jgi:hypothetical protein
MKGPGTENALDQQSISANPINLLVRQLSFNVNLAKHTQTIAIISGLIPPKSIGINFNSVRSRSNCIQQRSKKYNRYCKCKLKSDVTKDKSDNLGSPLFST